MPAETPCSLSGQHVWSVLGSLYCTKRVLSKRGDIYSCSIVYNLPLSYKINRSQHIIGFLNPSRKHQLGPEMRVLCVMKVSQKYLWALGFDCLHFQMATSHVRVCTS
jgi:hypothetical protein